MPHVRAAGDSLNQRAHSSLVEGLHERDDGERDVDELLKRPQLRVEVGLVIGVLEQEWDEEGRADAKLLGQNARVLVEEVARGERDEHGASEPVHTGVRTWD